MKLRVLNVLIYCSSKLELEDIQERKRLNDKIQNIQKCYFLSQEVHQKELGTGTKYSFAYPSTNSVWRYDKVNDIPTEMTVVPEAISSGVKAVRNVRFIKT